jgi:glycosyltransferase involved in cell wall biosynthesis
MRIALEVFGTQSASRHRGVGRYTHEFVNALLDLDSGHEFLLYAQDEAPTDYLPGAGRVEVRFLRPDAERGERSLSDALRRLLGTNEDRLDLLLLCNPSELRFDYLPPSPPLNGIKLATILYDLVPLLFRDHYIATWPGPEYARQYFRGLERIKRYDAFLALSAATREDAVAHLGLHPDRVTNIGGGSDHRFFTVDHNPLASHDLEALGIVDPFVFSMGAMEYRKNLWGLIDAFAALSEPIRSEHQLVITYDPNPDEVDLIRKRARQLGILDRLVLTGRVDDRTLRELYRNCAAFIFPSRYEGFGLPVHEAMLCGAAVIAGNNSSQIEIVGDAGLLADAGSADDMRDKLEAVLSDDDFADDLRRRAPVQAAGFSWKRTAELGLGALEALERGRTIRFDRPHRPRPRIAFFSPFPPMLSGISDYSDRLVEALKDRYSIDIYHDAGYVPEARLRSLDFACHDHRLFRRNAAILDYHAVVYQMGNSPLHKYMYEELPLYPGLVTLHDFSLAAFRYWDAMVNASGHDSFRDDLKGFGEEAAARYGPMLDRWSKLPGGVVAACARAGLYVNHRVFKHATGVIFHSPWCLEKAKSIYPDYPGRLTVVPYGATVDPASPERRSRIRERYGLPQDALIVGNFGLIHPTKMNVESIRAFAPLAERDPDALFILVGPELDHEASRECVEELGLEDRVRFLGVRPASEFVEIVAAADIGLNLRRPPTNGETSSSLLDLLRQGIPTIITDVGTFADFPDHAVRKLPWVGESSQGLLTRTLLDLAESRAARDKLGAEAVRYVRGGHDWSQVAALYAEAIEASRSARAEARPILTKGPHFSLKTDGRSRPERSASRRRSAR